MICKNCKASFSDGYNVCPNCHTPVAYQQPVSGYSAAASVQNNNQHKINIALIICIASIVLALIICITAILINNSNNNTSKYELLLQSYTNDPAVDIQELDFDNDSETEAYIITGKKANDGFNDADIWFIDKNEKVHPIKQTVIVKPPKIIKTPNNHPYVTYEIYSPDNTTHSTYVYGVQDSSYYEPPVSGKYFDLHLDENNRLVGQSVSDNKTVEFDINDAFEIIKSYIDENNKPVTSKAQEQPTPTTSKAVIEKTTKNKNNNGYLTATDSDFKDFLGEAQLIYQYNYDSTEYNSSSSDAYEYAITSTYNVWGNVYEYCSKKYGWSGSKQHITPNWEYNNGKGTITYDTPDPLHRINGICGYSKIEASKIDWVLKNVFNVTPDHSMDSSKLKKEENDWFDFYYYNGYYYICGSQGGDAYPTLKIASSEQISDGSYKITVNVVNTYEGNKIEKRLTFKTALRKVDGNKVWTIFSIENA